uniref:Uncharacterized protein n=1 Tax=Solanum lycopersicum TaxID=4081 RepID=A0A3Q7FD71_SOLLC
MSRDFVQSSVWLFSGSQTVDLELVNAETFAFMLIDSQDHRGLQLHRNRQFVCNLSVDIEKHIVAAGIEVGV